MRSTAFPLLVTCSLHASCSACLPDREWYGNNIYLHQSPSGQPPLPSNSHPISRGMSSSHSKTTKQNNKITISYTLKIVKFLILSWSWTDVRYAKILHVITQRDDLTFCADLVSLIINETIDSSILQEMQLKPLAQKITRLYVGLYCPLHGDRPKTGFDATVTVFPPLRIFRVLC